MTTTHELTLDLQKKGELQRIDVVQGDAGTRLVELTLVSNGYPWEVPVDATPAVRYLKPDGSSGVYDHLPDGGSGFRFDGNVLTMELAPQLLTCAGAVQVQVELSYQEQRIATFAFLIVVEQAVAMDGETGDYVNWTKLHLPQVTDAEQGQFLQVAQVDEDGRVVELAPVDDPAAEVKAQIPVLENHISAVGQRVEDASVDAHDALVLATKAVEKPQTAEVGQILAVKAVTQDGYPTEWETVDLPAGGAGIFHVFVTDNGDSTGTMDKTYEELMAASAAGRPIVATILAAGSADDNQMILGNVLLYSDDGFFMGMCSCLDANNSAALCIVAVVESEISVLVIPIVPDTMPNPEKLTFTGAVETEYDGSAPVSIEIPTGGNAGVFRLSVTTEAASEAVTVDLPVAWGEVVQFNIHMNFGAVSGVFELRSSIGTNIISWADVETGNNVGANINGLRYMDGFFAAFINQSAVSHGAAMPSMGGNSISMAAPDGEKSINFFSATDGVMIPAGTKLEMWGVYGQ